MTFDADLDAQLVVLAKAPVPGKVKTRLCPPYSLDEAARLAAAAMQDTLDAVAGCPVVRRVLVLDGDPGPWLPAGFDVIAQRGDGLAERIENALADTWSSHAAPLLLVGMDTPQVESSLLSAALDRLLAPGVDAVLGPARDGGFWALGVRRPAPDLVSGVPMSTGHTGSDQLTRLEAAGLQVQLLATLRDVDTAEDALAVAAEAPRTRFAATLDELEQQSQEGVA